MNIHKAFPSKYLSASDLGEVQPVVTITDVKMQEIGQDDEKELKPVLFFEGKDKGLVLNKTNALRIADLLGSSDTEDWVGGRVRLFATETQFGAKLVPCIRVKAATNGKKRLPDPEPAEFVAAERAVGKRPVPDHEIEEDEIPF